MEFSEDEFINELINRKKSKRLKIIHKYLEIYEQCIAKIRAISAMGKTDMFFTFPVFIFGFIEYNNDDCCNFLMARLKKLYMDISRINENTLFISWYYIEVNKNRSLQEQNNE